MVPDARRRTRPRAADRGARSRCPRRARVRSTRSGTRVPMWGGPAGGGCGRWRRRPRRHDTANVASVSRSVPVAHRRRRNRRRGVCWMVCWLVMASSLSDRGLGVVLDGAADLAGPVDAGEAGDEVQRHVDAGADAGAGDDVPVVDEPGVDVGDRWSGRARASRSRDAQCVVAGRPASRPGGGVDEAPVHTLVISGTVARCTRTQSRWSGSRIRSRVPCPPGWMSTSSGGIVVERVVRAQDEALGGDDGAPSSRHARDGPAVLGVVQGPVREDLPRADGVELLDVVEQQQPDVAAAFVRWSWASLVSLVRGRCWSRGGSAPGSPVAGSHAGPGRRGCSPRSKCRDADGGRDGDGRGAVRSRVLHRARARAGASCRPRRTSTPRAAGAVVVRGEPGVGKSALLDELVEHRQ